MNLRLANVGFSTAGTTIVSAVHLEVIPGEPVVLLGPNGAGKSTLLRLISGWLQPTTGEVLLNSTPVRKMPFQVRSRRMAVLTQQINLEFPFTVREVVEMGRMPHDSTTLCNNNIVDDILQRLQLDESRIYTSLSGGEQQLVQIGRVLAQVSGQGGDALLLLDEPAAPLDLCHQQLLFTVLGELAIQGLSQIIVMHDVNLAMEYAHQVVLMAGGRILAKGRPLDVMDPENLSQTFGVPMEMIEDADSPRRFFRPGTRLWGSSGASQLAASPKSRSVSSSAMPLESGHENSD